MSARAHLAVAPSPQGDARQTAALGSKGAPRLDVVGHSTLSGDERIGEVLHGTYRVDRLIAEGGMGSVYEVHHERLQQRFAAKILEHQSARNDEAYARFRQEAEIAASLNHPSIVQVFDFNTDSAGNPYMVMELVEGPTLNQFLAGKRLNPRDILRIFEPLCMALDAAHRAGIVHRDLKPSNIMVRRVQSGGFEVKLLDFGISKMKDTDTNMTRDNVVMGTPNYMSPEQARGNASSVDVTTDIFALGAILYEAFAGRRAFEGDSPPRLLHAIVYEDPPKLENLRRDLSPAIVEVVQKCLAKDASSRFSGTRALYQALKEAIRPPQRRLMPEPAPAPKPEKRSPLWAAAWVLSMTASGVAAAILVSNHSPEDAEATHAVAARPAPEPTRDPEPEPKPQYEHNLASPSSLMLMLGDQLYRADGRGLTHWTDPEAPPKTHALPSVSPVTVISKSREGAVLVGQADGTVSHWDRELREPGWHRKFGTRSVTALTEGSGYLAVANGKEVHLLNTQTGRMLRKFPGVGVVELLITRGPNSRLLIVRTNRLTVVDTDRRRMLTDLEVDGKALRARLEAEPTDKPTEISVDFLQGDWIVRRRFALETDARGNDIALKTLGIERL